MEWLNYQARREFPQRDPSPFEQLSQAELAGKIRAAIDANKAKDKTNGDNK